MPLKKSTSLFNLKFKTRLEPKVQNRVKQISVPTSIAELTPNLKTTYKTLKTSNTILYELNCTFRNVMGFATKIENWIIELNEIEMAEEVEANRNTIITNNKIVFNEFIKGLRDQTNSNNNWCKSSQNIHRNSQNSWTSCIKKSSEINISSKNTI